MCAYLERHADFDRIRNEFIRYYKSVDVGHSEYMTWLKELNLDENRSYGSSQREKFSFIKPMIAKLREDKNSVYYRVLVGMPLRSMNDNLYSQSDLTKAAEDLINAFDCNLNHVDSLKLPGVRYIAARFEDGAVEAVLKVPKSLRCSIDLTRHMYDIGEGKPLYEWIDEKVIVNQSLEADYTPGFHFVGSALLTKDTLPGIPLSRIFPLESVVSEALSTSQKLKAKTLKIQVTGLKEMSQDPKTSTEPHQCPVGQHWDNDAGACVPDVGATGNPQGTDVATGQNVGDDSKKPVETVETLKAEIQRLKESQSAQEMASLRVAKNRAESAVVTTELKAAQAIEAATKEAAKKIEAAEKRVADVESSVEIINKTAEVKIKAAELKAETAEQNFVEESKKRSKLEGELARLEKETEKLNERLERNNKGTIEDGQRIKDYERRLQDSIDDKKRLEAELETTQKKLSETQEKLKTQLKVNLDQGKELTKANEELLKVEEAKTGFEEKLKKAKRLANITVKI